MKGLVFSVLAGSVCLLAASCASQQSTQKNATPIVRGDEIQVTALSAKPLRPVPFAPWRGAMTIKNVSSNPLVDTRYVFVAGREEIGRGRIPLLLPRQQVEVISDLTRTPPGSYRLEGKILIPGPVGSHATLTNSFRTIAVVIPD